MEQQQQEQPLSSSTHVTLGDENEQFFQEKPELQITRSLNGTLEEGDVPSARTLFTRQQQLRLQIEDRQAYSGARCFLYLFEAVALLVYLLNSLFERASSWGELIIVLASFGVSINNYRLCNRISSRIQPPRPVVREGSPGKEDPMQNGAFYCGYCKATRGLRVKHCVKCDACIYKYDHHCFWVGNCIGQLNQFNFYLFLFSQTVFNCAMAAVFWRLPADTWLYWLYMLLMVLAFGFAIFTGFLLLYHTMLIATSQTTWQHIRRHRISYLKNLPKGCHPFSKGFLQNLKQFFTKKHQLTHWQIPPNIADNARCDPFDNQYYSCC